MVKVAAVAIGEIIVAAGIAFLSGPALILVMKLLALVGGN